MKATQFKTFLILILGGLSTGLFAQNKPKSLDHCIQIALENNLTLKSGKITIEKAKELQGTAFNIEKTNFSLTQDPSAGGSPDNSIALSQSFDFPTVYTSRSSLLKAKTNLQGKYYDVSKNELIKEVSSTYYQLLLTQEKIGILQKQDSIYSHFLHIATIKVQKGETNRLEQMNAERIYNENQVILERVQSSFTNIQLNLQRWLNTEELIVPVEQVLTILEPKLSIAEFNVDQTPLAQIYETKRDVSEKNLKLTKNQFLPSFNLTLKNQLLLDGFNPYNITRSAYPNGNFMGFEIGISVPLFFGEQRAKVKAANKDLAIAAIEQQNVKLKLEKEYQACINEYNRARKSLDYYLSNGNKQADEIARISQISYEKGEINYIEYIQNLKTIIDINLQYIEAKNECNQAIIQLNYLKGNGNKQ